MTSGRQAPPISSPVNTLVVGGLAALATSGRRDRVDAQELALLQLLGRQDLETRALA